MGITNDTIVVYSSDNGPHMNTWPDGAMTWFRSEKNTNWEGAFRVPCLVRWPGVIKPGTVTDELMSHNDWIPTLCAMAGEPDIVNKLKTGYTANGISYKVHLDGFDQTAFLRNVSGTAGNNNGTKSARDKFFYADDDGMLVAMRKGDYKYVYAEQRAGRKMGVWAEPFTKLRLQKIFNLFQDPFERADITSNTFWDWQINHVGQVYGVMDDVFHLSRRSRNFRRVRSRQASCRRKSWRTRWAISRMLAAVRPWGSRNSTTGFRRRPGDRPAPERLIQGATQMPREIPVAAWRVLSVLAAFMLLVLTDQNLLAQTDPLPSWNDGATKKSIADFVARVTAQGNADFVPVERRIATIVHHTDAERE